MKRRALALTLVFALLFSAVAGTQFADLGRANPLPELYQELTIVNRNNGTTNENTITVNFALESQNFFQWRNFSYSLDGKELKAVDDLTVVSSSSLPTSPTVYVEVLRGSCVLSNLSVGWHNVTVYLMNDARGTIGYGGALSSANAKFIIEPEPQTEPEPTPTTLVVTSIASVAFVSAGLLVYFKKRQKSKDKA